MQSVYHVRKAKYVTFSIVYKSYIIIYYLKIFIRKIGFIRAPGQRAGPLAGSPVPLTGPSSQHHSTAVYFPSAKHYRTCLYLKEPKGKMRMQPNAPFGRITLICSQRLTGLANHQVYKVPL